MKKIQKQTIYDIAQKAGASASTVSAALNGTWKSRRIKEETAQRIQEIAEAHGYLANLQARGLRKAKSGLVGMILPQHDNRFFSALSQSFATEARARGLCPVIVSTRRDPEEEVKSVESLVAYAIDWLFIAGASDPDGLSRICRDANLLHVFVDQPCPLAPSVVSDNYRGAAVLTEKIIDAMPAVDDPARAKPFFLGGDGSLHATSRRIAAFRNVVEQRFGKVDDEQIIACSYDPKRADEEIRRLCDRLGGLPAGLFINSVDCFEGVLGFLVERPKADFDRCAIGCYDFDPYGAFLQFPVDMVRQRSNRLITKAYEFIDTDARAPALVMVEPELFAARRS
ncbi:MAG: LacI family DNA-binding transcriptional regulator [Hyphomicrobiales bacterium]|nr:LacI family DNA-binding transcriptional regulator [Hyphomicrobiales bacterium]